MHRELVGNLLGELLGARRELTGNFGGVGECWELGGVHTLTLCDARVAKTSVHARWMPTLVGVILSKN